MIPNMTPVLGILGVAGLCWVLQSVLESLGKSGEAKNLGIAGNISILLILVQLVAELIQTSRRLFL